MVDNNIFGEETLQNLPGEMANLSSGQVEIEKVKIKGQVEIEKKKKQTKK